MEERYKEIPCVYFSCSGDGHILDANKVMCEAIGFTFEELTGRKLESVFTLATRIFQQTHLYPLLQLKGHAEEIYITLRSRSGADLPVLINAIRKEVNGDVQLHFAGIIINQRKKYEDEIIAAKKSAEKALAENTALRSAQEQLQKHAEELDMQITKANSRNLELKQMNHTTTHSLQEPLRKILFFSNQVGNAGTQNVDINTFNKIRASAEDMDAKLKALQQYIWLSNDALETASVNLNLIINSAREQIIAENAEVDLEINLESLPSIEGNSKQLNLLFKELLSNAVRFRKPGSITKVNIDGQTLLLNKFRQLPEKYKYTEFLKLQIQDEGIGFEDAYQEQAFELFRKLHPVSGRGIGLSLSRKIVENHNGSIALQSQPGVGTNVVVFLPIKQK